MALADAIGTTHAAPAGGVIAARLSAQGLTGTAGTSPEAVVHRLLAVQAQDPRGARLAVRSRSAALRAADVDDALTSRRSLVVSWLNRGTLHLVAAEDYWWLHPLTTPQLAAGNRRRLEQEGVSPAQARRGVEVVTEAVAAHGPQTRGQLGRQLASAGVPTARQALVHVLLAATLEGRVVRGPMAGSEQAFVSPGDWLGEPPEPMARPAALARLARRYLAGHGPASAADLAKWAGLPLGPARAGLEAIRDELVPVSVPDGGDGRGDLVDLAGRETPGPLPPPRLLGAFDPLLLGWTSRLPVVGRHTVVTTNGIFHPVALVDGRVVARWGLPGGVLTVTALEPLASETVARLRDDGADVLRFLDLEKNPVVVAAE